MPIQISATFTPSSFGRLKKAEEKHFWFQIRKKWISDRIMKFIAPPARVLEVGCGTGNVSSFLAKKGYSVTGCEFYPEAIKIAWPGFQMVQGDANNLPFGDNSFDIVGLFDVIEHFDEDLLLIKEAIRIARKGGIIAVTVPARRELWSIVDEAALHKRRYSKESLKHVLLKVKLNILSIEYMFMSLYMPMRFIRGKDKKNGDQFKINRLVNTLLKDLFNAERVISKVLALPLGTSLMAIARKDS